MRLKNISPKKIISEGVRYGKKQENWVLSNLDKFRFGIEMEVRGQAGDMDLDHLEAYYTRNSTMPIEDLISNVSEDGEKFIEDLADNLSSEVSREVDEADEVGQVDDYFIWVLNNVEVFKNFMQSDDVDERYRILKQITDKQNEISVDPLDDIEESIEKVNTAYNAIDVLVHRFECRDFFDELKNFHEELMAYVDEDADTLYPISEMTQEQLEGISDSAELQSFMDMLVDEIELHFDHLESMGLNPETAYNKGLEELYRDFLTIDINDGLYIESLYKSYIPTEYTTFQTFVSILPINENQYHLLYDVDEDDLYDRDGAETNILTMMGHYDTEYNIEEEHDGQLEIISSGVITGEKIETAFEDSFDLLDELHNVGIKGENISGLHISISIPEAQGRPDIGKFLILSNIMNLIPEDKRNVRYYVEDIRKNYTSEMVDLINKIQHAMQAGKSFSAAYAESLEKWAAYAANPNEKRQTVNFGTIDAEKGRIEIRMYGGKGYKDRREEIWNTTIRSMYALSLAYDRSLERNEYLKTVNKFAQDIFKENIGFDITEYMHRMDKMRKLLYNKLNTDGDLSYASRVSMRPVLDVINNLLAKNGYDLGRPMSTLVKQYKGQTFMYPSDENLKLLRDMKQTDLTESAKKIIKESSMRLKDIADISIGMENADFYIQRRGSKETVGTVSKTYSPEAIGIKIHRTDLVYPDYLYYVFEHLHGSGYWKGKAKGSISLVNITVMDVRNIQLG